MQQDRLTGTTVQAVPLIIGQINVGAGTYTAQALIHCEADGAITLSDGITTYNMTIGMDRAYSGEFTVTTGTFTYD